MHLKNVLNFIGVWSYPLGLITSGLFSYLGATMHMQPFTLNEKNVLEILFGGLAVPCCVTLSNLFDFVSKVADEILPFAQSPFYVITNKDCADGCCAVLSDSFMQKTAEHLGCQELYLLPSSRHEMIAVNAGNHADSAELKKIVEEVNSMTDTVSEKDFLSNSVYKYDAKTHSLSMCDSRGLFHNKANSKDAVKQTVSKRRGGL